MCKRTINSLKRVRQRKGWQRKGWQDKGWEKKELDRTELVIAMLASVPENKASERTKKSGSVESMARPQNIFIFWAGEHEWASRCERWEGGSTEDLTAWF